VQYAKRRWIFPFFCGANISSVKTAYLNGNSHAFPCSHRIAALYPYYFHAFSHIVFLLN
jgi:hypothetical protein